MTILLQPRSRNDEDILKARAKKLATEEKTSDRTDGLTVLAFRMARESYGIELSRVRGTHPMKDPAYIPGAPAFVLGIINLRGEILSVVDLKKIFDLPDDESDNVRPLIIISNIEMEFCLVVDEIIGVRHIPTEEISPSLPSLTGIRSEYLLGVSGDGMVILDGNKLLNAPEMRIDIK
jgi:purine-binding chemotaxis protein CheW